MDDDLRLVIFTSFSTVFQSYQDWKGGSWGWGRVVAGRRNYRPAYTVSKRRSLLTAGCLQRTFAGDSQLKYIGGIWTNKINNYVIYFCILLICLRINFMWVLNISTWNSSCLNICIS